MSGRIRFRPPTPGGLPFGKPEKYRGRSARVPSERLPVAKPVRVRDGDYLAFLHEAHTRCQVGRFQPISGYPPVTCSGPLEAAHVDFLHTKGYGSKSPDVFAIVMCREHHQGRYGLGRMKWEKFEQIYRVDLRDIALANVAQFHGRFHEENA